MRAYGYEYDGRTIRPNEAQLIRETVERVRNGDSFTHLAARFTRENRLTAYGKPWDGYALKRTVTSNRVAGLKKNGEPAPWPAIITPEDRDQIVKMYEEHNAKYQDRAEHTDRHNSKRYLLTGGLAVCGKCGTPLVPRPITTRSYACPSSTRVQGCGGVRIAAAAFEEDVTGQVISRIKSDAYPSLVKQFQAAHVTALKVTEGADAMKAADLVRLQTGEFTEAEYQHRKDLVERQLEWAKNIINAVQVIARAPDPEVVGQWWKGATVERRSELAAVVVENVVVNPLQSKHTRTYDPSRVEVNFRTRVDPIDTA